MNISLPQEMREFTEADVARNGYGTSSEYIRALVRDARKRRDEVNASAAGVPRGQRIGRAGQ